MQPFHPACVDCGQPVGDRVEHQCRHSLEASLSLHLYIHEVVSDGFSAFDAVGLCLRLYMQILTYPTEYDPRATIWQPYNDKRQAAERDGFLHNGYKRLRTLVQVLLFVQNTPLPKGYALYVPLFTEIGQGSPRLSSGGGIARRRSGDKLLTTSINGCTLVL